VDIAILVVGLLSLAAALRACHNSRKAWDAADDAHVCASSAKLFAEAAASDTCDIKFASGRSVDSTELEAVKRELLEAVSGLKAQLPKRRSKAVAP
jgi:hypothetical protein